MQFRVSSSTPPQSYFNSQNFPLKTTEILQAGQHCKTSSTPCVSDLLPGYNKFLIVWKLSPTFRVHVVRFGVVFILQVLVFEAADELL